MPFTIRKDSDSPSPRAQKIAFDNFEVDLRPGELRKNGARIRLQAQPFQLLVLLLEHPGEMVTREEICRELWPKNTFVDFEHSLPAAVNKIRGALGDAADNPRYIETLPKRGYRFIGEIHPQQPRFAEQIQEKKDRQAKGPRKSRRKIAACILASAGCAVVAAAVFWRVRPPSEASTPVIVPFTALPGLEFTPTFSPDGSHVAFAWDGGGPGSKGYDLYVKVIGSETLIRLTNYPQAKIRPAWSPDGSQIAFHRISAADTGLYLVPSLGGPERKLISTHLVSPSDATLSWSPDGKWIALADARYPGAHAGLFLFSLETLKSTPIQHLEKCIDEVDPAFSPDGRRLAFVCHSQSGGFALYSLVPPDGVPELIKEFPGWVWGIAWTSDARRMVFAQFEAGKGPQYLYELRIADGSVQRIPSTENAEWPAISPKGDKIAYDNLSKANTNIWRREISHPETAAVKLIGSTRNQLQPQYSPDGKHIAFTSDRGGSFEIWMSDTDGTNVVQISDLKYPVTGSPSWSPDGTKLAFDSGQFGHANIYIADIAERVPRKLVTNVAGCSAPNWSRDGKSIYFVGGSTEAGGKIYRCPATGGDAVLMSGEIGYGPAESFDGNTLFFATNFAGNCVLHAVPLKPSSAKSVLDGMPPIYYAAHWTLVPGGIYFVPVDASRSIRYFDFATKRVHPKFEFDHVLDMGLSVSPDGRWILYPQAEVSSDIMLVEHFR